MCQSNDQEQTLFNQALDIQDLEGRSRFLEDVCSGQSDLRRRIEYLLDLEQRSRDSLDQPIPPCAPLTPVSEGPGAVIGRYKLLEQIGEGGMGVVYMAEQQEPVNRKVALKIIKLGMDTKLVVARFGAERQALALMDHPHIARVLDGGATETGRPYFVMDLVRGIPITEYCTKQKLTTRERLELFIPVCQAIQHAHQKGIIHRDLKPGNVMVTLSDGVPHPMVIDFGVAKATNQKLTEQTLFTNFGQMLGTPAYMAPEQAEMSRLDVDTRSDIYSLGVLLYELLTGTQPFPDEQLRTMGWAEMQRVIAEKEPVKPSTRVTQEQLGRRSGKSEIRNPKSEIDKDLDCIVMKCLEKDRRRRYETANGLARDIQRHLANEPITAHPPSRLYEFQKTIRRHKVGFAAAGTVIIALCLGLIIAIGALSRERAARKRATAAEKDADANYLMARRVVDEAVMRTASELQGEPRMVQVRRMLLEDALRFHQLFLEQKADDPELELAVAETYMRVGNIYRSLGRDAQSLEAYQAALALYKALEPQAPSRLDHLKTLRHVHRAIGLENQWLDRSAESIVHRQRVVEICEELRHLRPAEPSYVDWLTKAHTALGNSYVAAGHLSEAVAEGRWALEIYQTNRVGAAALPQDPGLEARINHWLGRALKARGDYEEAEERYRGAFTYRIDQLARNPDSRSAQGNLGHISMYLGELLRLTGQLEEAEQLLREGAASHEEILDLNVESGARRRVPWCYAELSWVLWAQGRSDAAILTMRRAVEHAAVIVDQVPDEPHAQDRLGLYTYELGLLLHSMGEMDEARQYFRDAIERLENLSGEPPLSKAHSRLGRILVSCPAEEFRDPSHALALCQRALQVDPKSSAFWDLLGMAQYRAGDYGGAIQTLERAARLKTGAPKVWLVLAMAHWQQGNLDQARSSYSKAAAWIDKYHPADVECSMLHEEAAATLGISQN